MKIKYPKTFHVPSSLGCTSDDKKLESIDSLEQGLYLITEKMDGENTTMMKDCIYARSLDSNNHPSRNYVKGIWGNISYRIPKNWRICGENLYAKHSIYYKNLVGYFYVYSIWNEENVCLSYVDTNMWCNELNLHHVPVLGMIQKEELVTYEFKLDLNEHEGYVVRNTKAFHFNDFQKNVAKWVRPQHVQTDAHWMQSEIVPNQLIYG
jgi:hypothetical protein